jgi:hypothetical protein
MLLLLEFLSVSQKLFVTVFDVSWWDESWDKGIFKKLKKLSAPSGGREERLSKHALPWWLHMLVSVLPTRVAGPESTWPRAHLERAATRPATALDSVRKFLISETASDEE